MNRMGNSFTKHRSDTARGFTIVELLIVIVVIGILAAITIVAFNGVSSRARDAAVQGASNQAGKKALAYAPLNSDTYPDEATYISALGLPVASSKATYDYFMTTDKKSFCLSVSDTTVSPAKSYAYTATSGAAVPGRCVKNYTVDPDATVSTANFSSIGSAPASSTNSIAVDKFHNGTTSYKRVASSSGQLAAVALTTGLQLQPGDVLNWSLWVYSTKAGNLSTYAEGNNVSDGSYGGFGGNSYFTVSANTWTKITGTGTVGAAMNVGTVGAYALNVTTGDTMWIDEFMVTKSSDATQYAQQSTANNTWVWTGSPNASPAFGPAVAQ